MSRPKFKLSAMRDIGWARWDPIGIGKRDGTWPERCEDEYDTYLLRACVMLSEGSDVAEVGEYLCRAAREYIGIRNASMTDALATAGALKTHVDDALLDIARQTQKW